MRFFNLTRLRGNRFVRNSTRSFGLAVVLMLPFFSTKSLACACGCGVFDIGNLFPNQPGGAVWVEYDYMDQNQNWHGGSQAPASDNQDKNIRTNFMTVGGQYLFDSGFAVMAELPYWQRHFATVSDGPFETFDHAALGDLRLEGAYSGFTEDRDTGVTFGIKLPTGDFTYPNFDRDTEIGSGSTDLMFGAYHIGAFDPLGVWRYFLNARYTTAVAEQGGYRPGDELDGIAGVSYDAGAVAGVEISPMVQTIGSFRRHDSESQSDPFNSGYSRVLIGPGVDLAFGNWVVHAEADLPVYQNMIGNQLTAPVLIKTNLSYNF